MEMGKLGNTNFYFYLFVHSSLLTGAFCIDGRVLRISQLTLLGRAEPTGKYSFSHGRGKNYT